MRYWPRSTKGPSPRWRGAPGRVGGHRRRRGTIPRWRGARAGGHRAGAIRGAIPALAGSTAEPAASVSPTGDHPRAGGEHTRSSCPAVPGTGPSPRWRGALRDALPDADPEGTIPALAGSTPAARPCSCGCRDHPRAGGEHSRPCRLAPRIRDHPRAGGEHHHPGVPGEHKRGLSPRWRGAPSRAARYAAALGTIPALAGSTPRPPSRPRRGRDHPRAGGEHVAAPVPPVGERGPSPRWRGARERVAGRGLDEGTIPALAGSTSSLRAPSIRSRDHPRAGGEHSSVRQGRCMNSGPSPRWRGAHRHRVDRAAQPGPSPRWRGARVDQRPGRHGGGTIPALAGST